MSYHSSDIDLEWLNLHMAEIVDDLQGEFPTSASGVIEATVQAAAGELAAACVVDHLPIMIRRRARGRLQALGNVGLPIVSVGQGPDYHRAL